MSPPLNTVIAGATGRMGRCLIEATLNTADMQLYAALGRATSAAIGQDAGLFMGRDTGVLISNELDAALTGADVLIDFTHPQNTLGLLQACQRHNVAMVIGTTGFDDVGKATILRATDSIGIVHASNFSLGINLMFKLLDIAARVLCSGYDVEIIETHHRFKLDAPSGTALRMGEVIANALDRQLCECAVYGRKGGNGKRSSNAIGFASVRGGNVIGDHTALFASLGERLEITHKAESRSNFADGAVRAAQWLSSQQSGLYDMQDVLGLR